MFEWFKKYNRTVDEISMLNIEILDMKTEWYSISGTKFDSIRVDCIKKVDIADQLSNIIQKENKLKNMIIEKDKIKQKHIEEIEKSKNRTYKKLLKLYYLENKTICEIACIINKSEDHTKKMKRYAINEFVKNNMMTPNDTK